MIKAEKITKKYGNLQVLDQIDMEVSKASVVSIVGRSGAGKSRRYRESCSQKSRFCSNKACASAKTCAQSAGCSV